VHLFGDPNFPKRNLKGGAIVLAPSSFQVGTTIESVIWTEAQGIDYSFLLLWVGLFFGAIKMFRMGLASMPPDPKHQPLNHRGLD
jgi:hypothetical protein